jgi:predicted nuclease with TOPRIM domain
VIENVENLILEHLRALRNELRDFKTETVAELTLIKHRLTSLESQVASVHADMALIHGRIDRVDSHIDRIDRRLELRSESN